MYLGWSGNSYRNGIEIYISDEATRELEPDASRGLHRVGTVGTIRHVASIGDCTLIRQPTGHTVHVPGAGDVTVRAERKLGLFEKLEVTLNGVLLRGREHLV